MLKDDYQKKSNQQLQQDLQFMLSSIRARENTVIFYLQKFKNTQFSQSKKSIEMKSAKNQLQQKDKIYSRQITSVLQKHTDFSLGENMQFFRYHSSVRAFWIKLKTILKVTIQRIQGLQLAPQTIAKLLQSYEKALIVVQRNSQSQKSLLAYKQVQNLFKKRSIQAIELGKQVFSPVISYSESKMQKNRSQTLFKQSQAPISISRFTMENNSNFDFHQSQLFYKKQNFPVASKQKMYQRNYDYLNGLADIKQQGSTLTTGGPGKIKSLNRIKNRKPEQALKVNMMNFIKIEQLGKLKSTSKASQKHIKKINKHVQRYEKNFQGAFDGKYELSTLLDKKKTIYQNIYLLYDDLFAKNIPNHKMISKFMFNTTKINQILYNAYEKKKIKIKKAHDDTKQINKKTKDKEKNKQKQKQKEIHQNQDKQRVHTAKNFKAHRKHYLHKDHQNHIDISQLNQKQIQNLRQKKQSETTAMTAMTSKQQKKFQKIEYEKQKDKIEKDKKIIRSKTAKIKLNSQILNPHTFLISQGISSNKHFGSQQNTKIYHKSNHNQKVSKTNGT